MFESKENLIWMYGRSKDNYKKGILPQENINGYIVAVKLRFGVDILISKSKKKRTQL